ncbi:Dihydrolipoyllysine-residue succinyltransferase, partial [Mucuna pruriens]
MKFIGGDLFCLRSNANPTFPSAFDAQEEEEILGSAIMFGVIRRRVASGSPAPLLLGQTVQKIRSGSLVSARASSIVEKEISFLSGRQGFVQNFCHKASGCWINSKPTRVVFHPEATVRTWGRPFSSESGDTVDVVVPPLAESISDGTLAKFLKRPGDRVNVDEPIAQIETDKVTIDVSSPESGVILKLLASEGDTVEPGNKIAIISRSADATHVAPSETTSAKAAPQPTEKVSEEKKAPKVETAPATQKPKPPPSSLSSPTEPQLPPKERERRVPMTRLRKRVATRLKDSQNTFAMLTTFNEVDIGRSSRYSGGAEQSGSRTRQNLRSGAV